MQAGIERGHEGLHKGRVEQSCEGVYECECEGLGYQRVLMYVCIYVMYVCILVYMNTVYMYVCNLCVHMCIC